MGGSCVVTAIVKERLLHLLSEPRSARPIASRGRETCAYNTHEMLLHSSAPTLRRTACILAYACAFALTAAAQTTVIKAGRLVNTRNGRVLTGQTIVVEKDRITQVGAKSRALPAPG